MADTAPDIARTILDGFDTHYRLFRAVSAGAKARFEAGDTAAVRAANRERIELYDARVQATVAQILSAHPEARADEPWPRVKMAYITLLLEHQQPELAETFFNSVACRVLHRRYFHNQYIFWRPTVSTEHLETSAPTWRSYYPAGKGLRSVLKGLLSDLAFESPWENQERDLAAVVHALSAQLPRPLEVHANIQVQVLSSCFFRNQAAYVIGRMLNGMEQVPFAVPIRRNGKGELYADALLMDRADLGTLFSLARAYFMVDMEVPAAFVQFLQAIFPDKPRAELYIALGMQKQGKTLFYRDLFHHLKHSTDRFVAAPGIKGMVMVVFTLPSYPYVFKMIRDRFEPPKDVDRQKVKEQYRLVKFHDRVGRMADTLEYSDVAFPLSRFDPELLAELEAKCGSLLERDGDRLVIQHLYIERRMTPLDLYVAHADETKAAHAMKEYGQAIRELALAGIFPGDLLPKNFGVTRFGRVVFYDYDEIAPLSECVFRAIPTPRDDGDEYASEAWFAVGPRDVFPEEWPRFIFADARSREAFMAHHADLCGPAFWRDTQKQLAQGIDPVFYPYPTARRFAHEHG